MATKKKSTISPASDEKVLVNFEVTPELRKKATEKAKSEGTTLSSVLRAAIQAYVEGELVFESKITIKKQ